MRSRIFSLQIALLVAAGCASRPAASPAPETVTTSGQSASPSNDAPAADAPAPEPRAAEPLGELVCKTTDAAGVTYALYVDGTNARLRRVAPSGTAEVRILTVQRTAGMIVADVPGETDVVAHAATVRDHHGARVMRIGDWNEPWLVCEK